MILVDFSQTVIAAFFSEGVTKTKDQYLQRHIILNMLRSYVQKFGQEYGQLVICADGKNTWRKQYFPFYKANRGKDRDKSDVDWKSLFELLNKVLLELKELSVFPVIHLDGMEADDVIATLTINSRLSNEKVLIISSDKDYKQLQQYPNVLQFSPTKKTFLKEKDASSFLIDHIIRGDSGDGIPNIFSDDDTFVDENKRQSPVSKKKLQQVSDYIYNASPTTKMPEEWKRNFDRNKTLIDFAKIPNHITQQILKESNEQLFKTPNKTAFLDYLIEKRCKGLVGSINEFFIT